MILFFMENQPYNGLLYCAKGRSALFFSDFSSSEQSDRRSCFLFQTLKIVTRLKSFSKRFNKKERIQEQRKAPRRGDEVVFSGRQSLFPLVQLSFNNLWTRARSTSLTEGSGTWRKILVCPQRCIQEKRNENGILCTERKDMRWSWKVYTLGRWCMEIISLFPSQTSIYALSLYFTFLAQFAFFSLIYAIHFSSILWIYFFSWILTTNNKQIFKINL